MGDGKTGIDGKYSLMAALYAIMLTCHLHSSACFDLTKTV
jgi:hypothetical protein